MADHKHSGNLLYEKAMSKKRKYRSKHKHQHSHKAPAEKVERIDISITELEAILEHARGSLSEQEYHTLRSVVKTLYFLTTELEKKHVSIERLKRMLFGTATESLKNVLDKVLEQNKNQQEDE